MALARPQSVPRCSVQPRGSSRLPEIGPESESLEHLRFVRQCAHAERKGSSQHFPPEPEKGRTNLHAPLWKSRHSCHDSPVICGTGEATIRVPICGTGNKQITSPLFSVVSGTRDQPCHVERILEHRGQTLWKQKSTPFAQPSVLQNCRWLASTRHGDPCSAQVRCARGHPRRRNC